MNIQPTNYYTAQYGANYSCKKQNSTSAPSFGAAKPNKPDGFFKKIFTQYYGAPLLNSDMVRAFSKKVASWDKKDASRHFQVVGSLVTSGAYMKATLSNKDFDKKNAKTLAVNQGLCFVIPTIAAYLTDAKMADFNKQLEYSYAAKQERKLALGGLTGKAKEAAVKRFSNSLKGVRVLMTIMTFTAIYRYLSPVAITPLANWIGNKLNNKEESKTPEKKAMEVEMKVDTNKPEVKTAA